MRIVLAEPIYDDPIGICCMKKEDLKFDVNEPFFIYVDF